MVYRLRLMGPFELMSPDGQPVPVVARKSQALLAILALAEGAPVPRSRLTAILWGDRGEEQARNSLRQALAGLRKLFPEGPLPLRVTDETAAIDPATLVTDIDDPEGDLSHGEFLDGLHIPGQPAEDWLTAERQRLATLRVDRLATVIARREAEGDVAGTIEAAQASLQLDPLSEPAHRALMRGYAAACDRPRALRQFQTCRDILKAELGVEPDPETVRLADKIRVGSTAPAQAVSTSRSALPTVAVLPFANLSADPEQEYFSDGITEDIITELTRFPSLFVIARNSSFTFKGKPVDVTEVGRKLGVEYVVEGSVRKVGTRVRITAQLVEAASGRHIWAERYDRKLEDIFAVQDEVVDTVTSKLGRSLRDMAFVRARTRTTSSLTAYEHLLHGRAAWWNGDSANAFRHVERALTADPEYAAAHAWFALQYTYDQFKGLLDLTIEERERRAHEHATAALQLGDGDPFVHMAVSMVFGFTVGGDKARALRHSDIAIALNPHDYECMYCRAYVLAVNGRCLEALEWLDRARRLSPVTAYLLCEGYFDVYRSMGDYEKALEVIRDRGRMPVNMYLHVAVANGCLGRWEMARSWMDRFYRERPKHFDVAAYLQFLICLGFLDKWEQKAVSRLREGGLQILD